MQDALDLGYHDHAEIGGLHGHAERPECAADFHISGRKVEAGQSCLLDGYDEDQPLTVPGCRTWIGDFFEQATAAVTRGIRLKTDCSADICPDIKISDSVYIESKSVGINGSLIVYDSRLQKDKNFVARGVSLYYCFWQHNFHIHDGILLRDLRDGAAKAVKSVVIVTFAELARILESDGRLKTLSRKEGLPHRGPQRRGFGSHGYTAGYQERLSLVRNQLDLQPRAPRGWRNVKVYGRSLPLFKVYGSFTDNAGGGNHAR
jgi:hypothetical protein